MFSQFMIGLLEWLGLCLQSIKGPYKTSIYLGETRNKVWKIRGTSYPDWVDTHIQSRQIVYRTVYRRWWIPNSWRTVYVVNYVAPEAMRQALKERLDPTTYALLEARLNETITYPMLCSPLLRWTRFPHTYAINAYLDRVLEIIQPKIQKVTL